MPGDALAPAETQASAAMVLIDVNDRHVLVITTAFQRVKSVHYFLFI